MRRSRRRLPLAGLLLLALPLAGAPAAGQAPAKPPVAPPAPAQAPAAAPSDPAQALREKRAQVAAEIAALQAQVAAGEGPALAPRVVQLELLGQLDALYAEDLLVLERTHDLQGYLEDARGRQRLGPQGLIEAAPPLALPLLDAVTDAREAQRARLRALEERAAAADPDVEAASRQLEQQEQHRRQTREAFESNTDPAQAPRLDGAYTTALLDSRVAEARRDLAAHARDAARAEVDLSTTLAAQLEQTLVWVRDNLRIDRPQLAEALRAVDEREAELTGRVERTQRALETAEQRLAAVQKRIEATPEPEPALLAEADARRAERDTQQRRLTFYTEELQRLSALRQLWEQRIANLSGQASRRDVRGWLAALEQAAAERERARRLLEVRLAEVRSERDKAAERAASADAASAPWRERQLDALDAQIRTYAAMLERITASDALVARTLEEMHARTTRFSLVDALREAWRRVAEAWSVELFAVADRSITLGKIAGALLVFGAGLGLASLVSRGLARLLVRRARLDPGAASAVQGLSFYLGVALFFLLALRLVNIPLTAFTVIGGALALGVGFGSQALVGNFISGLILMAERPIRVGDLIEIEGTQGHVERIGPRSTRIRMFNNTHVIVPNTRLLEQNVVNWTLADDDVRAGLDVGVAYGSPTREVERLILQAIREQGKVLPRPEPQVFFVSFAESALLFRAFFWIRSRVMGERLRVESDVRHRVDELFRESGIVIAFPQRDVHLHAAEPLRVELAAPERRGETPS